MIFRRCIATAIIATLSLTALPSFAQSHGKDSKDDKDRKNTKVIVIKQEQSDRRNDRSDYRDDRKEDNRAGHSNQRSPNYYYNARSAEFKRGHRLPSALRNKQYVVSNPQRHNLKSPPRGQQWVQVGSDYVLVAITTGLIASIVLAR